MIIEVETKRFDFVLIFKDRANRTCCQNACRVREQERAQGWSQGSRPEQQDGLSVCRDRKRVSGAGLGQDGLELSSGYSRCPAEIQVNLLVGKGFD